MYQKAKYRKVKALILNNEDGGHYDLSGRVETNNTKFRLKRSKIGTWAPEFKGEQVAELHDHGNGVVINVRGKEFRADYLMLEELKLVLREYYRFARPRAPRYGRVINKKASK